jgi:5-methylcytosine-specific restriction enzyme subunit McrC
MVACRFEDLTVDTPRNRFVRAALDAIARIVHRPQLTRRCRAIASSLKQLGVSGEKPSRSEVGADRFGRHDADDQLMIGVAQLAFDLALPTEATGSKSLAVPEREDTWIRHLYEKAVGGFYDVVLSPLGWRVDAGRRLGWLIEQKTTGIDSILPSMLTDVVMDHYGLRRRIVIETKFTRIVTPGRFRKETLQSEHVYQLYSYLRSQEGYEDLLSVHASGLLLYPSIGEMVDETVVIQGHAIRFATVDLSATAGEIRDQLMGMVEFPVEATH